MCTNHSREVCPERKMDQDIGHGFRERACAAGAGDGGTLVGIPLYLLFSVLPWPIWLITVLAFTCLAWHVADEAERLFGRKDAQCIVIDEIAGLQWTLFLVAPTAPIWFWVLCCSGCSIS